MKIPFFLLGDDLLAEFECTCFDLSYKDHPVFHSTFHTRVRLTGYADLNFFDNVNKSPRIIKCPCCNKEYSVQWFRDGVEVESVAAK